MVPAFRPLRLLPPMLTLLLATASHAETRYVTDQWRFELRSGNSNEHRIIDYLGSGTAVEVLEPVSNGFIHISTAKGVEGWMRESYLQTALPATLRLEQLTNSATAAAVAAGKLPATRPLAPSARETELETANQSLTQQRTEAKALCENAAQLDQRNRELLQENQLLQDQSTLLKVESERLREQLEKKEFYLGAGAILLGLLLGVILPHLKPKRKYSEWR